jgi:hypothetical protein
MTAADYRAWHDNDGEFCEWMETLPTGTFVTLDALDHFRWPIDPADASTWLFVGCAPHLDVESYRRWYASLPAVGVMADPGDPRFRRMVAGQAGWE